jgi:hypothetical protein
MKVTKTCFTSFVPLHQEQQTVSPDLMLSRRIRSSSDRDCISEILDEMEPKDIGRPNPLVISKHTLTHQKCVSTPWPTLRCGIAAMR